MKQKLLFTIAAYLISANLISAQYIVRDQTFSANSVSNQGKVSGYESQAGPYLIWLPDSGNSMVIVGGIAPGNGVGGQARFSTDGNFLCGTSMGTNGAEMSKYNRATNQWTPVGSLGFQVDGTMSGGFAISGDGNTIAGNSWADTSGGLAFAHAVAWNQTEGVMDLGSLYFGKNTRVNALNYDGSVAVGYEDYNSVWKSAVWQKKPSGGYYPNHFLLIDTGGSATDDYNQLGECSAVSADGKWIGGYGDYANNNQPWIWSKDSGVINLGTLPNVGNGFVAGITADASIAVGWFDGQLFGDPQTPFIWTRAGGLHELNNYIHTVLGDSTDTHQVFSAECISPDGHYIAGYGVDNSTFSYFVYRVSLTTTLTGVQEVTANSIKVYPNPASNLITIENSNKTVLTITSMDGKVVCKTEMNGTLTLDISAYAPGIYSLTLQSDSSIQTQKIVKTN